MPSKDFVYTQGIVWALWVRARELEAATETEEEAAPYRLMANHYADEFMMDMKSRMGPYMVDDGELDGIDLDEVLADSYAAHYGYDETSYPAWPKEHPR